MTEQRTETVEQETPLDDLHHWWTSAEDDIPVCEYPARRLARLLARGVSTEPPPQTNACVVCLDYYLRVMSGE